MEAKAVSEPQWVGTESLERGAKPESFVESGGCILRVISRTRIGQGDFGSGQCRLLQHARGGAGLARRRQNKPGMSFRFTTERLRVLSDALGGAERLRAAGWRRQFGAAVELDSRSAEPKRGNRTSAFRTKLECPLDSTRIAPESSQKTAEMRSRTRIVRPVGARPWVCTITSACGAVAGRIRQGRPTHFCPPEACRPLTAGSRLFASSSLPDGGGRTARACLPKTVFAPRRVCAGQQFLTDMIITIDPANKKRYNAGHEKA